MSTSSITAFYPRLVPGTTLVVVDMQQDFLDDLQSRSVDVEPLIAAVLERIQIARERNERIIVLNWAGKGDLDNRVLLALQGYEWWIPITKSASNGAKEVRDICLSEKYPSEQFELVGLYANQCVYDTAVGLSNWYQFSRIRVLAHACCLWIKGPGWEQYQSSRIDVIWPE